MRAERNDKIDNALDAIDAVAPLEDDVPLVARAKTKGRIELPKDTAAVEQQEQPEPVFATRGRTNSPKIRRKGAYALQKKKKSTRGQSLKSVA